MSVCQPLPPPNYHWALNHQAMLLINIYPNSTKMQSALWLQHWWSRSMVGGCSLLSLGASLWLGTGLTLAFPTLKEANSNQPIWSKLLTSYRSTKSGIVEMLGWTPYCSPSQVYSPCILSLTVLNFIPIRGYTTRMEGEQFQPSALLAFFVSK